MIIELFYIVIFVKLILQCKTYNDKGVSPNSNNISMLSCVTLYLIIIKIDWSSVTIIGLEIRIIKHHWYNLYINKIIRIGIPHDIITVFCIKIIISIPFRTKILFSMIIFALNFSTKCIFLLKQVIIFFLLYILKNKNVRIIYSSD